MRHVLVALGALAGFVVGFAITFLVGIQVTASSECDGPCFDRWDEVTYVGYGIGGMSAIACALGTRSLLKGRSAHRNANPS